MWGFQHITSGWLQSWNATSAISGRTLWSKPFHDRLWSSTLRWVGMYAGIGVMTCMLARFKCGGLVWKENEMLYHFDFINKCWQYCYPIVRQPTLPNSWKTIWCSISATPWSLCKAIWTLCIEPDQIALQDKGTMKIKAPMRGCSIRKEITKGLDSASAETVLKWHHAWR